MVLSPLKGWVFFLQLVRIPWDCMNGFISTFRYVWHKTPFAFLIEHFKKSTKTQQTFWFTEVFGDLRKTKPPSWGTTSTSPLILTARFEEVDEFSQPSPGGTCDPGVAPRGWSLAGCSSCAPAVAVEVVFLALEPWYKKQMSNDKTRWWFQTFFIFTLTWGRWTQFDKHFSNGLKPPTRKNLSYFPVFLGDEIENPIFLRDHFINHYKDPY